MITQGKWLLNDNDGIIYSEGQKEICWIPSDDDEDVDNARLIAAAPELLAACKGFMRFANRDLPKNAIHMIPERFLAELRDETNKIKQAIAKAEQT